MTTTERTGIEFDVSDREVLLVCHNCNGVWRAFAWTMAEAEAAAIAHEFRAHPGTVGVAHRVNDRHAKARKRANVAESLPADS